MRQHLLQLSYDTIKLVATAKQAMQMSDGAACVWTWHLIALQQYAAL